jgi:hypothetical protein
MADADPRMVPLRTGVTVSAIAAVAIWVNIQALHEENRGAWREAVLIARDPGYGPAADSAAAMRRWRMLDGSGRMHDVTRAVLLASAEGDGDGMTLRPPHARRGDPDG